MHSGDVCTMTHFPLVIHNNFANLMSPSSLDTAGTEQFSKLIHCV